MLLLAGYSFFIIITFRETFPVLYNRWKHINAHCNDSPQSIHQSSVSRSDNVRLPELAFDRLQLTDEECCGIQTRGFGRFVARSAVLDEEYWVRFCHSIS